MAKYPKFLICENPMAEYGVEYVLHTQTPRFLAKVVDHDITSNFEVVEEIDSFIEYGTEKLPGLMRRLGDWWFSYLEWEEKNAERNEDEEY